MGYPLVFYLVCIAGFISVFGYGVSLPFLPLYSKELGASETMVGVISAGYFISRLFLELPSGMISDKIGRRAPLLFGMLLTLLGAIMSILAFSPLILLLARAVWGAGTGLFFSSTFAFIFDLFHLRLEVRPWEPIRASNSSAAL